MRTFKIFTAAWFAMSSAFVTAKPVEKVKTPAQVAAELFNAVGTADSLYAFMQIDASDEDKKFIEELRSATKDNRLPRAYAKDDAFYMSGLEKPLRMVDARKSIYSYDGRNITFDWSKGFKANYLLLEKVVRPKRMAWLDWVLPQAHAGIDFSTLLSGALIGGGLMGMFGSSNPTYQTLGGVAAIGGVLLLAMNDKPKKPKVIDCTGGGMREVLVRGADGRIYRTISGYSYPYQASPGMPTAYSPYVQPASSYLTGLCNSPQSLAQANYAMSLPEAYRAPSVYPNGFYNSFAMPAANRQPASTATGLSTQSVAPARAWPSEEATASK